MDKSMSDKRITQAKKVGKRRINHQLEGDLEQYGRWLIILVTGGRL